MEAPTGRAPGACAVGPKGLVRPETGSQRRQQPRSGGLDGRWGRAGGFGRRNDGDGWQVGFSPRPTRQRPQTTRASGDRAAVDPNHISSLLPATMAIQTTSVFRDLLQTRTAQYPPSGSASGSGSTPGGGGGGLHRRKASADVNPVGGWVDGRKAAAAADKPRREEDAFLKEAYQIVRVALADLGLVGGGSARLIPDASPLVGRGLAAPPSADVPLAAVDHPAAVPRAAGGGGRQGQGARAAALWRQGPRGV